MVRPLTLMTLMVVVGRSEKDAIVLIVGMMSLCSMLPGSAANPTAMMPVEQEKVSVDNSGDGQGGSVHGNEKEGTTAKSRGVPGRHGQIPVPTKEDVDKAFSQSRWFFT